MTTPQPPRDGAMPWPHVYVVDGTARLAGSRLQAATWAADLLIPMPRDPSWHQREEVVLTREGVRQALEEDGTLTTGGRTATLHPLAAG